MVYVGDDMIRSAYFCGVREAKTGRLTYLDGLTSTGSLVW